MTVFSHIEERITRNRTDFGPRGWTPAQEEAWRVFLELGLDCRELEDLSWLAVLVPHRILGWEASLYLTEQNTQEAILVATTKPELQALLGMDQRIAVTIGDQPICLESQCLVPLPRPVSIERSRDQPTKPVVGMLGLAVDKNPLDPVDPTLAPFLAKYASALAVSLRQRLKDRKNRQHIHFVKGLVTDIGHNVIVPNIFFKAYLRRLGGKILRLIEIQDHLNALGQASPQSLAAAVPELAADMAYANDGLLEELDHIQKHYESTSLFLESLFRQSHFEQGQYVLQKKMCNFRRDIIDPQIERFRRRLIERNIEVDLSAGGVPDEVIEAVVDIGLISQVFSNLVSNAVKYTRPVNYGGATRKFIAYGLEVVPGAFGPGRDGIKINLFSTGRSLDPEERHNIFEEGYRGANAKEERGTGHGLFFIKDVVQVHGGHVGVEPTPMGNNFYFILPK